MKFLETHFEEYANAVQELNLHPKLEKVFERFPASLDKLGNLIYYGPSGTGKYSQMLNSIKRYSPTELKYEKKLTVVYDKTPYYFKISDIHYEIDMSLLGCNSKLLWHDIYQQIVDILSAKTEKTGIIVCKEFHSIHSELLDTFYSYMQENNSSAVSIKFILLTEAVSFIPDPILNCCEVVHFQRPTKMLYAKCCKTKPNPNFKAENIANIKDFHLGSETLVSPHKILCDKIIRDITNIEELKFLKFRDYLYDIFIYNLDIAVCIKYILTHVLQTVELTNEMKSSVFIRTYQFLKYYNNNYRPIYHLESYLYYLVTVLHGFGTN